MATKATKRIARPPAPVVPNLAGGAPRAKMSGFDAGSRTITRIANWNPRNTDATSIIVNDGDVMRARSRQLVQQNPWAAGGLAAFASSVIGTGIVPASMNPDKSIRRAIDEEFEDWSANCDAAGVQCWADLQKTITRAQKTDGEVLIRKRLRDPKDGHRNRLKLQVMECDHLPLLKNEVLPNGLKIRAGIQFDGIGQRTLYHLYQEHPGGGMITKPDIFPVQASEIMHVFEILRPGQIRGLPWLTPAIVMLYDIKQLLDATLLRQKIVNLLSVFITQSGSTNTVWDNSRAESVPATDTEEATTRRVGTFEPGSVNTFGPGEKPEFLTPPESGTEFNAFLKSMLRAVAKSLDITFEMLTGDLSEANYSRSRMSIVDFRRSAEAWQWGILIHQFCRPVWDAWLFETVMSGVLGAKAIRDYDRDRRKFSKVSWNPPAWPWIDPVKDIDAAVKEIRAGLSTRSIKVRDRGYKPEEIDEGQALDNERADDLDLVYDSDGRRDMGQPNTGNATDPEPEPVDPAADPAEETPAPAKKKPTGGKRK